MLLVNNLPFLLTHCQRTSLINITTFVLLFNLPELIRVKPPWHNQPCVLIHWFYFYFIFTVNRVHGKGELNILLPYLAVISTAWSKALDPSSNTMWGGLGWGDLEKWGNTRECLHFMLIGREKTDVYSELHMKMWCWWGIVGLPLFWSPVYTF